MSLCKYKNILGIPNQGIHKTRILGFAFWDIVGTILLGMFLSQYTELSVLTSIAGLFILAQVLHYVFCVDTAFMKIISS
jgi:hypothetical protein